jgi:hypothetical protein
MPEYRLRITDSRPYFAELPYYLWGRVNYDSEGNCKTPLDRNWTWMELTNRDTGDALEVTSNGSEWTVSGPDPHASRLVVFLHWRCAGDWVDGSPSIGGEWKHADAIELTQRVAKEFENAALLPFAQGHLFWGSWKWIGWFGTTFTWVGRWIMDSVIRNDVRAVALCIDWLREGTYAEGQSSALRYALGRFTGRSFATDREWVNWYDGDGKNQFPEPDMDAWYENLKDIHGP